MPNEVADAGPGAPPDKLPIDGTVDGWIWRPTPVLDRADTVLLAAGAGIVGFAFLVVAPVALLALIRPDLAVQALAVAVGLSILSLVLFLVSRRRQRALFLTRRGLRIEGFRRQRDRTIPWASIDAPRVVDARDEWGQAFESAILPGVEPVATNRALSIRWTADGRPAAVADHRTEWQGIVVGRRMPTDATDWLIAAFAHVAAESEKRRRAAEFDEIVSGREGERDLAALESMRGKSS